MSPLINPASRVTLGLATTDSPEFVTVKLSGLTDGYIPYHVSDAAGLGDSIIKQSVGRIEIVETDVTLLAGNTLTVTRNANPTAVSTGAKTALYGINRTDNLTSWNQEEIRGLSFSTEHRGGGTLSVQAGIKVFTLNSGAGTTTSSYGGFFQNSISAGLVSSAYGVYIQTPSITGGTITTNYGLYIASQAGGGTNYNIYSVTGTNYFGGPSTFVGAVTAAAVGATAITATSLTVSNTVVGDSIGTIVYNTSGGAGDSASSFWGVNSLRGIKISAVRISGSNDHDMLLLTSNPSATPTEKVRITGYGKVGIGTAAPTAILHLKAGTATASTAPLKFTSGALLTAAEDGAIEYLSNFFYIRGSDGLGIGPGFTPAVRLHVGGTAATDIIRTDIGLDFNPVVMPASNPTFTLQAGSDLEIGAYRYALSYYTALGETNLRYDMAVTTTAGNRVVSITNIPVSTDYRVTGKRIYRNHVGAGGDAHLVADISNATTSYVDTTADASLPAANKYYQLNTTNSYLTINSLRSLILDLRNTTMGVSAGIAITEGGNNTLLGSSAGVLVTTGTGNTFVGHLSGREVSTSLSSVGIGSEACRLSGSYNTCVGAVAGRASGTGGSNVLVGYAAGYNVTGGNNVKVGYFSGYTNTAGASSVFLGYQSGYYETASNSLYIDNVKRTDLADGKVKALIYGIFAATTAAQYLYINGNCYISDSLNIPTNKQITFRDAAIYVYSSADGWLNLVADTGVEVNSPILNGVKLTFDEAEIGDGTNYVDIGTTGNVTFAGSAGFYPRLLSQATKPAAGTGATEVDTSELVVWDDSDGTEIWLVFNDAGTVKGIKVETI